MDPPKPDRYIEAVNLEFDYDNRHLKNTLRSR